MKITTFACDLHQLSLIKDQGLTEVILGHKDFSRFGKLSDSEFENLKNRANELGIKVIFEWDILMAENVFQECLRKISPLLSGIDALRVQDPGALHWAIENTTLPLQFIAENGNHNLEALLGWRKAAGRRLERLILSIELSKDALKTYIKELDIPCELLGFGRILLFYSPRSLLAPILKPQDDFTELAVLGESEESPHKGFPIVENRHGTFMFHIKEFCLLDYAQELKGLGLEFFRLDLRWESFPFFKDICSLIAEFNPARFESLKEAYPQDFMRGFYLVNKTDVLFPKLKNSRLQKREGDYVGEVLEAEKGSHLAILIKNPKGLKRTDKLKILHPKGEEFEIMIHSLRNICLEEVEEVSSQSLALIPFVNGVWVKSQVFYL